VTMRTYNLLSSFVDRARKRTAPLLVALLAFGCVEPLSPTDVAGRYDLQRVQNSTLPFFWTGPADEPYRLLSGHLELFADGTAEEVMNVEQRSGSGTAYLVVQRTTWRYELDGVRLTLRDPRTPCQSLACTLPGAANRQLRFFGPSLIGKEGLQFLRYEDVAQ
jgi:hypothetical protein